MEVDGNAHSPLLHRNLCYDLAWFRGVLTMHRIELDSVRIDRNDSEYRMVNRARCGDLEVIGDGLIIRNLAKLMLEQGLGGQCTVHRNEMQVFSAQNVSDWASGRVFSGEQPEALRKYQSKGDSDE